MSDSKFTVWDQSMPNDPMPTLKEETPKQPKFNSIWEEMQAIMREKGIIPQNNSEQTVIKNPTLYEQVKEAFLNKNEYQFRNVSKQIAKIYLASLD